MKRLRSLWITGAVVALALGSAAQQTQEPGGQSPLALYQQLNQVAVDPSQVYLIRHARLARGGINLYFDRGFIGFFTPVEGRITGAVFEGEGEVLLLPPNPAEKRSLAQFTKSAVLEEQISTAYLRFTDGTAQELLQKARKPDPDDPSQPGDFALRWNAAARPLDAEYSTRILEDLLGDPHVPFFQARVEGITLGRFVLTDDERAPEAIRVTAAREAQGKTFADVWCAYPSPASKTHREALGIGPARVISYKIETRIEQDNSLEGRAVLDLESYSSADRILPFDLSPQLRVTNVTDEQGRKLAVLPETTSEDSAAGIRKRDWIAVALDAPHAAGSRFRLAFTYQGSVITDVGNGVLYVGSRGSWYPHRGENARASFDLTFRYPDRLTLVATGRRVEEGAADGWRHSRWVSDGAFSVAGFNLGAYRSRGRKVGKVSIEVYATREAEAALQKRFREAQPPLVILSGPFVEGRRHLKIAPAPPPPLLDPAALLDDVLAKAADAVRYFDGLFGPFPYPRLALAQIPGDFGQGWPELVYLPTLSFISGKDGPPPGQLVRERDLESGLFVAHEIAHQWWGNELGWKSYHDQWLSEGFASYAAALALARERGGEWKFRELLRSYKQDLLGKNPDGQTVESGGPIWLGHRLTSSLDPSGYDNIVYKKSCWVLHMLRKLMADPKPGSDARFFSMLRALVRAYDGRNPSTEDFLALAGHYMTPAMDLDRTHRLDWFFEDWVYGTGIPGYKLEFKTRRIARDQYAIEGAIRQSGVLDDFEMLVPVVAVAGRERKVRLGRVAVTSAGGKFRFTTAFKPSRVSIDDEDLLAIVK